MKNYFLRNLFFSLGFLILFSVKPLFGGVAEGIYVRKVQTFLAELCFDTGPIDGIWGKRTDKAAEKFFEKYFSGGAFFNGFFTNLEFRNLNDLYYNAKKTGRFGSQKVEMCSLLNNLTLEKYKTGEKYKKGIFGTSISSQVDLKEIQKHLKDLCFEIGAVDGKFDEQMYIALIALFDRQGVLFDRKIDQRLLNYVAVKAKNHHKNNVDCEYYQQKLLPEFDEKWDFGKKVEQKLSRRSTINTFAAWSEAQPYSEYQLAWSCCVYGMPETITLLTPLWNYYYPGRSYYKYPLIEKFLIPGAWNHDSEYGVTLPVDYTTSNFREWFSTLIRSQLQQYKADGVMLDWWHDRHSDGNGFSKRVVRQSRHKLAQKLREDLGANAIIMGNVNWGEHTDVKHLNGVFLELYKSDAARLYNTSELREIEQLLIKYNEELRAPKLIALEGWRKTKSANLAERNSLENRKMAKLLTAMSVVIPRNGYILYGDNNQDALTGEDHEHIIYDFYSFDIGAPRSGFNKIKAGAGFKEHEEGVIAYNITSRDVDFMLEGTNFTIQPKSGLFCKERNKVLDCLPID